MKPADEKKGETPDLHSSAPRVPETQQLAEAKLKAKQIKLTPEGVNQADIDVVLKRLAQMRKRLREDILFVGGRLAKMRDHKIAYGNWTTFVERTFPLSVKTANIWIRAWENRDSELAVNDWESYMRALYGNEPKKLKAPSSRAKPEQDDEERDDLEQSGGEGFQMFFPDKGKPGFLGFKNLTAALEHDFFASKSYTLAAKQQFITDLINWLETQRKNLRSL
jgi:hypothetical protein